MFNIILASASPRRKELLSILGFDFEVIPASIDESIFPDESPSCYAMRMALEKANSISLKYPQSYIIGADTVVTIDEKILGKPKDKEEAFYMLNLLSGKKHIVITGFSIINRDLVVNILKYVETEVVFKKLNDYEINWYIETGEPFDKAGAYAIQGIGSFMVKSIYGSYTNVVGLPLCELIEELEKLNINVYK